MHRRDFLRMVSCMVGGAVLSTSTAHAGLKLANKTLEASMGRKRPNIIYIMADDLGYNHLGCYGQYGAQGKIRTPNIDKLASQGMRFSQAYAGGNVCGPSRAAIMMGIHGGHLPFRTNGDNQLSGDYKTIGEIFKQEGYATGYFGKYGIYKSDSQGRSQMPGDRGFDEFWGLLQHGHGHFHFPKYIYHHSEKVMLPNENCRDHPNPEEDFGMSSYNLDDRKVHTDDVFSEKAVKWVRNNSDKPFFCYLSFSLPHAEMLSREEIAVEYRKLGWPEYNSNNNGYHVPTSTPRANFAGMVTQVDEWVGKVMTLLDEMKIADNTIVVFTSDNGGEQRNSWANIPSIFFEANGALREGKRWNYEGGLRVPFIVRWPNVIKPSTTTDHICYFPDLMPTFADIIGVKAPDYIDGISFLPTLVGKPSAQQEHEFLYWEDSGMEQAVRMGKWKGRRANTYSSLELYDLETDIGETTNVASSHPDIVSQIVTVMNREHESPTG